VLAREDGIVQARQQNYIVAPEPVVLPVEGSEAVFAVRRLYCVGRNYVDHIREMKEGDERDPPFFFQKPADAIVRDGGAVPYPAHTDDFQHEIELVAAIEPEVLLVTRRLGNGIDPKTFGFRWFLPSIWRYRKPIGHVLLATFFVQIFALVSPLFFQVVVDKVLSHRGYSTLFVLVAGLVLIGLFDITLQYLRTYALAHTTNRIDVELGKRLFRHLTRLPVSYFETRATGQTVARVRELESIRSFLTGQGLFSALDFLFVFVFIAVLFAYSWKLTLIVLATIPLYLVIAALARPFLSDRLNEKFNRGAESQQLLVEAVVGMQTIKAAAVEPVVATQWEERLAAYVRSAFSATMLGAKAQNAVQFVSKISSAALLLFGAKAVIDG